MNCSCEYTLHIALDETFTELLIVTNIPIPASTPAVLSPRSHQIFARPAIEKHIAEYSTDPITDESLSIEELIEIQREFAFATSDIIFLLNANINSIDIPTTGYSQSGLPSLIKTFTNEYEAVALQNFQLRKELEKTKKELASTLYMHDAAVRVAARIKNERDEALADIEKIRESV